MEIVSEKNTTDTKSKLISVISSEYVSKLKGVESKPTKKSKNGSNSVALDEKITFADITVWFYKKNCPQCLDEARVIWDSLPETLSQKQNVGHFFDAYANYVMATHEKYVAYISKCKKVEKMISRTKDFIRSINERISPHFRSEITDSTIPSLDELSFEIILDSIEGYDLDSVFQRKDLLGHQLEFGYKDNKVTSSIIRTNGNSVLFQKEKLRMKFSPKSGSIFINLVEKYGQEEGEVTESKCVAMRNLDLFTNVNEWFIKEIMNNPLGDSSDGSEEISLTKKNESEVANRPSERVFETFVLKKKGSLKRFSFDNSPKTLPDENFVKLTMSIEIPAVRSVQDLRYYSKLCEERTLCLKEQLQRARTQASGFKRKMNMLIAPFESVKFTEKTIEFEEITKKTPKHACNIF